MKRRIFTLAIMLGVCGAAACAPRAANVGVVPSPIVAAVKRSIASVIEGRITAPASIIGINGGNIIGINGGNVIGINGGNVVKSYGALQADPSVPIKGAVVYLTDAAGNAVPNMQSVLSDAKGAFHIPNVPAGFTFRVVAHFMLKGGKDIHFATLAQAGPQGGSVKVDEDTTLVTAVAVVGMNGGSLGNFNAVAFQSAADDVRTKLVTSELPDFADPGAVRAKMNALVTALPELQTQMSRLEHDLTTSQSEPSQVQAAINDLAPNASGSASATNNPEGATPPGTSQSDSGSSPSPGGTTEPAPLPLATGASASPMTSAAPANASTAAPSAAVATANSSPSPGGSPGPAAAGTATLFTLGNTPNMARLHMPSHSSQFIASYGIAVVMANVSSFTTPPTFNTYSNNHAKAESDDGAQGYYLVGNTFVGPGSPVPIQGVSAEDTVDITLNPIRDGNLYVSLSSNNNCIFKVDLLTGKGSTFGPAISATGAFADGPASVARLNAPQSMCFFNNVLYVADTGNHRIRAIAPDGSVSTYAGNLAGFKDGTGTNASFQAPTGIAVDDSGNLYVADRDNHVVRKIAAGGIVTTIAGNHTAGDTDGTGTAASLNQPVSIGFGTFGARQFLVVSQVNGKLRLLSAW